MGQVGSTLLLDIQANVASLKQSLDEGKNQLTSFKEGIGKIGEAMAGAFAVEKLLEYGKQFAEFINQVGEATQKVKSLTDLTGAGLQQATASVLAASQTFKTDFNETLQTTNSLAKQFGISFSDASKLVSTGLALNESQSASYLNIIKSYSRGFIDSGVSASQFSAIVTQSLKSGIGEAGVQAIQKFLSNVRLMNPAAQAGLAAVGLSAEKILDQLDKGTKSPLDVLQEVSTRMAALNPQSQAAGTALAAFGREGSKLGTQFVESLAKMKTSMAELVAESGDNEKALLKINDASTRVNAVWVSMFGSSSVGWNEMKATMLDISANALEGIQTGLVNATNFMIDLYNNSILFRTIIQAVVLNFKLMFDSIKLVWNILYDTFSNGAALVKAFLSGGISQIPAILKKGFTSIKDDVKEAGVDAYTAFKTGFENTANNSPLKLISLDKQSVQAGSAAGAAVASGTFTNDADQSPDKAVKTPKQHDVIGPLKTQGVKALTDKDIQNLMNYVPQITERINTATDAWTNFGIRMQQSVGDLALQAIGGLGDALGKLVTGQKAAFSGLVVEILKSIEKIILGLEAEAIAAALAGGIEEGGPIVGLGLAAVAIGAITAIIAAHPFAMGTDNAPGGLALVGEHGPELVSLPATSAVINNSNFTKVMSGGSNNMNISGQFKVAGTDLVLVLNETNRKINVSR